MMSRLRQWGAWNRGYGTAILAVLVFLGTASARAGAPIPYLSLPPACPSVPSDSCRPCLLGSGGSGEIPTPLGLVNQTVELAAGEVYTLEGRVTSSDGYPFLQIDLHIHPWLANAARVSFPFYALDGGPNFWRSFIGKRVKIMAKAQWMLVELGDGSYSLGLYPLAPPTVLPMASIKP